LVYFYHLTQLALEILLLRRKRVKLASLYNNNNNLSLKNEEVNERKNLDMISSI
jgi:hypothetical protein